MKIYYIINNKWLNIKKEYAWQIIFFTHLLALAIKIKHKILMIILQLDIFTILVFSKQRKSKIQWLQIDTNLSVSAFYKCYPTISI